LPFNFSFFYSKIVSFQNVFLPDGAPSVLTMFWGRIFSFFLLYNVLILVKHDILILSISNLRENRLLKSSETYADYNKNRKTLVPFIYRAQNWFDFVVHRIVYGKIFYFFHLLLALLSSHFPYSCLHTLLYHSEILFNFILHLLGSLIKPKSP
jgi:hypothetical protein